LPKAATMVGHLVA
jgi:hypothetical protein